MDRSSRVDSILLILVLFLAAIVRLATLVALRHDLVIRLPLSDAQEYLATATALARGEGWPPGPHFLGPIYPLALSLVFRVAPASVETVQWFQLLLGLATTALVILAARRVDRRAALPAGLFYALCGPAIVYENQVLMESLLAVSLALFAWILGRETRSSTIAYPIAGIAAGVATAGRPAFVLLLPLLLVLAGRRGEIPGRRGARACLALLAFCLVVLPPSLRNTRETGRPTFVTVSGGLNLFVGNNPSATGLYSPPPGLLFLDQDPTGARSASRMSGRPMDAAEASRYFAARAWDFARGRPIDALRLLIRKAGFLVSPDEVPQIENMAYLGDRHRIVWLLGFVGFPLLFPLALLGIGAGPAGRTIRTLCLGVLLAGASVHLVFFSTARYRIALYPALAVLAAIGLLRLFDLLRARGRSWPRLWPAALGLVLLLLAPRYDRRSAESWACYQEGVRYDRLGTPKAAAEMYRRSLELEPTRGEAWHNLGAAKARDERVAEALDDYAKALQHLGEHPRTLYNIGVLYGRLGMDERALEYLDRSLAADPTEPAVRVDRGVALFRLGRKEEAYAAWRTVARDSPGDPSLARTLARLSSLGIELPADLQRIGKPG